MTLCIQFLTSMSLFYNLVAKLRCENQLMLCKNNYNYVCPIRFIMDSAIEIENIPFLQREILSYSSDPHRSESEESEPSQPTNNPKRKLNLEVFRVQVPSSIQNGNYILLIIPEKALISLKKAEI